MSALDTHAALTNAHTLYGAIKNAYLEARSAHQRALELAGVGQMVTTVARNARDAAFVALFEAEGILRQANEDHDRALQADSVTS